jgi:hypothetical protein
MAYEFVRLVALPPQLARPGEFAATTITNNFFREIWLVCLPGEIPNPRVHGDPVPQKFTLLVVEWSSEAQRALFRA